MLNLYKALGAISPILPTMQLRLRNNEEHFDLVPVKTNTPLTPLCMARIKVSGVTAINSYYQKNNRDKIISSSVALAVICDNMLTCHLMAMTIC